MRLLVDCAEVTQLLAYTYQQSAPDILMGDLASPEQYRQLDLRSRLEELPRLTSFRIQIVIVDLWPKPDFLKRSRTLTSSRISFTTAFFVPIFSVVHQSTDRRSRIRLNLDQVKPSLARHIERFARPNDPYVLTFFIDQPDFRNSNALIYPSGSRSANRSLLRNNTVPHRHTPDSGFSPQTALNLSTPPLQRSISSGMGWDRVNSYRALIILEFPSELFDFLVIGEVIWWPEVASTVTSTFVGADIHVRDTILAE
jgi:hypothetical protein